MMVKYFALRAKESSENLIEQHVPSYDYDEKSAIPSLSVTPLSYASWVGSLPPPLGCQKLR